MHRGEEEVLLAQYLGLVKWIAKRTVPANDVDDAISEGMWAIIDAHRRYDSTCTFSHDRWIRLAIQRRIIDGHRARHRSRRQLERPRFVSLEQPVAEGLTIGDVLPDDLADVDSVVMAADLKQFLADLWFRDPADRRVLDGMLAGKKLVEIAEEEHVTASRISQRALVVRHRVERALAR